MPPCYLATESCLYLVLKLHFGNQFSKS
uniref:Uncharacterized protein n=1 Tax=Anguilla anguilla TaxID=7936 RepID=A0A0E9TFX5_ANGAN